MAGGPLSQLYYKGVREGVNETLFKEGFKEGMLQGVIQVYLNCRNKGMSIEESEEMVYFADRESLDMAEEKYQRQKAKQ